MFGVVVYVVLRCYSLACCMFSGVFLSVGIEYYDGFFTEGLDRVVFIKVLGLEFTG